MKKFLICFFAILGLLMVSCAKRGNIDGGPKDTIAPILSYSLPENFSRNFKAKEITLEFDEYVKLKDVSKQLVISPPMTYAPDISPTSASKKITIRIKDTLKENTTYSFNFGQSIQDNNEGNPLPQFKYVFSTGAYIDSLKLDGTIGDALEKQTDHYVTVMLYELNDKYTDSIIYKEKPRYVTSTLDSAIDFSFENLKDGKYVMLALKDSNNNYKFDPKTDKIGFVSEPVMVPGEVKHKIKLFKETGLFKALKPSQASGSRMTSGYEGDPKGAVYTVRNGSEIIPSVVSKLPEKDSMQIWFKAPKVDSLSVHVSKGSFEKDFIVKIKNEKKDTLSFTGSNGTLNFRDPFVIKSSLPLAKTDSTKISFKRKDDTAVAFHTRYDAFNQRLEFLFEKEEDQKYTLELLPGALTDFYDKANDTLTYKFSTKKLSEYGNLRLKLVNARSYPVIIELTDAKGKILATEYATGPEGVEFIGLEPAVFNMRAIYDTNSNKQWDSGSWLEKRQPEEVLYFPKDITVRSNWDVTEEWDLGG